jgi:hypothetical protein
MQARRDPVVVMRGIRKFDAALKILSGQAVPKKIVLGTRLFTKENVGRGGEPIR